VNSPRYTAECKDEAVRQITECGYSVAEVFQRLGVSGRLAPPPTQQDPCPLGSGIAVWERILATLLESPQSLPAST